MNDFQTTQWSVVLAASKATNDSHKHALESLCESYWYPLYSFVRRYGFAYEEAEDLTQSFFLRFIDGDFLGRASPERGRFRSFLLICLKRYLINHREAMSAQKRGGRRKQVSFDFDRAERRYLLEPKHEQTPDRAFERQWALTLLSKALADLENEQFQAGRGERFAVLRAYLTGDSQVDSYAQAADQLGMTPSAVKVAVYRLRQRYAALLKQAISQTLEENESVEDELQHLFSAISK